MLFARAQYENTTDFIEKAIEYFLEAAEALENEKVAFLVKMPRSLWEALTWYAERTRYWVSNDHAEKTYNRMIVDFIEDCMEMEADRPTLATNWVKHVLGEDHGLKPRIPLNDPQ